MSVILKMNKLGKISGGKESMLGWRSLFLFGSPSLASNLFIARFSSPSYLLMF